MKLRLISAICAAAVTTILVLAMLFVCRKVLLQSFSTVEQQRVNRELGRTLNLLRFESQRLDNLAQDYATWDDTWQFMADHNPNYVVSNYGELAMHNLNLRLVMLVTSQGEVAFLRSQPPGAKEEVEPHDIRDLLSAAESLASGDRGKTGVLFLSGAPVLVAVRAIRTSNGSGKSRGVLLMARDMDERFLSHISVLSEVPLSLRPVDGLTDSAWQDAASRLNVIGSRYSQIVSEGQLAEYALIGDFYDRPKLIVRIAHDREIWQQGRRETSILMAMIVMMGMLFGSLNVWLIHRYVVSRIEKLIHFTSTVNSDKGLHQRIPTDGNDEIAQLGDQLNQMLDHLQLSQENLRAAGERLQYEATHDGLTGTWNRAAALEMLDREIDRCSREQSQVAVIMFDIDHFKSINDRYGHSAGDTVLKSITAIISRNLRSFDVFARYGGEEFLLIAPNCSLLEARGLTYRILHRLQSSSIKVADHVIHVSASAGITVGSAPFTSEDLIAVADRAMYHAKANGRNCAHVEELEGKPVVRGNIFAMPQRPD